MSRAAAPSSSRNKASSSGTRRTGAAAEQPCEQAPPVLPIEQPKYDPKELRDAARIFTPFLMMLDEPENPYARLVARELCCTYFHMRYPGRRQEDLFKEYEGKYETSWSHQLWTEFWQYTEEQDTYRPWTSLKKSLTFFDESSQAKVNYRFMTGQTANRKPLIPHVAEARCCADNGRGAAGRNSSQQLEDVNEPDYFSPPDSPWSASDSEVLDQDRWDSAGGCRHGYDLGDCSTCDRQPGGNDNGPWCQELLRECAPELLRPEADDSRHEVAAAAAADRSDGRLVNVDEDDAGAAGPPDGPIECNATMVANAFANISYAEQDLHRKREAYRVLRWKYMEFLKNPIEAEQPCPTSPTARQVLRAIYENPPRVLAPFDDSEVNGNAFRDRDFVRLLPFYEAVLNQLEYASAKQREYGFDMLEDIMSTLYHIYYDVGDPRLKNDVLVDNVKVVTRNTWQRYFYPPGRRMPQIPEPPAPVPDPAPEPSCPEPQPSCPEPQPSCPEPQPSCPAPQPSCPAPQPSCPAPQPSRPAPAQEQERQDGRGSRSPRRAASRPRSNSRRQSVVGPTLPPPPPPRRSPPRTTRPAPRTPAHKRPTGRGRLDETGASANASRRSRSNATDAPPPPAEAQAKRPFLRRSRPSGAPKPWAPTLKAQERPPEAKTFRARPLPKFVRDRLNSQNQDC